MAITNASRLADFGSGIGTAGAVLQIDNANDRIGIGTTNPDNMLQVGIAITMNGMTGVITAQSFSGDGAGLTGVSGFATALSSTSGDFLNNIFQTPEVLPVGAGTSVQITGSSGNGNITFTRFGSIHMGTGSTLTVSTGTTFITNVLSVF